MSARAAVARLPVASAVDMPYVGRMTGPLDAPGFAATLQAHERHLWGICYRMTGSAADADDLVQETFARALARRRTDLAAPRAWLTRVAVNLARDVLRKRRNRAYVGPWLPAVVETGDEVAAEIAAEPSGSEHRYDELESVSFAFLLALEALTPKQRAVLLLRDVFDYSVREVAAALSMSEAGVNTMLRRARRAMSAYDAGRTVPTRAAQDRNRATLEALLRAIVSKDVAAIERLLARDVRYLSDGGGEFSAAGAPIVGAWKLVPLLERLLQIRGPPDDAEVRMVNGFPAVLARYRTVPGPRDAPAFLMRVDLDADGRVRELHSVLATRKLAAVGLGARSGTE